MNQICNITFVCSHADLPQAIDYLRRDLIPSLLTGGAGNARCARIRAAETEAASLAVEFDLPGIAALRNWRSDHLNPALEKTAAIWGERLCFFQTLLEPLPLS